MIGKVLKYQQNKAYKKNNNSKASIDEEFKAICRSKKLYKPLSRERLCIIEDDETYCKKDFSQLPGQQYIYQSKGRYVTDKFKYIKSEKFAPKFLE